VTKPGDHICTVCLTVVAEADMPDVDEEDEPPV
jgi:hypothetical protein